MNLYFIVFTDTTLYVIQLFQTFDNYWKNSFRGLLEIAYEGDGI